MLRRLVFAGGGTRCLVFLSALKRIEPRLAHVTEWWGTSAGSLLAALFAMTKSADRVRDIMHQTNFEAFRDISLLNLVNFTSSWGMDDGYSMVSEIERILEMATPGGATKTLGDVSGLRIVVADLNLYETVICSEKTFPTLRVVDAIRASMSLPVMYRPFRCPINGNIWVDGGLRAGFPWECLTKEERKEALGFAFERAWMSGPRTFTEYMFSMLHFEDPKQITTFKKEWRHHILWFPPPPFPAWYVRLKEDDYELLETMGNTVAEEWLKHAQSEEWLKHVQSEELLKHAQSEEWLKHAQSLEGMSQNQQLSEVHCTPLRDSQQHHTNGMLGIPPPSPSLSRVPFRDPQPCKPLLRRRWSL